jgi:hypothetical protein
MKKVVQFGVNRYANILGGVSNQTPLAVADEREQRELSEEEKVPIPSVYLGIF